MYIRKGCRHRHDGRESGNDDGRDRCEGCRVNEVEDFRNMYGRLGFICAPFF